MNKIIYMFFATIIATMSLIGCASTPIENFEKIHVGMHKDSVLDTIGSPLSSSYKNEEYVWTYRFYEGEAKVEKELRFKNDLVAYVGEAKKRNAYERLKVGMEKSEVLDLMGFPKRVENKGKSEVWTYADAKSLVISEGKVQSLGAFASPSNTVPNAPASETPASDGFQPIAD